MKFRHIYIKSNVLYSIQYHEIFCEIFVISMEFLSFNYLVSNELQCISQVIIMLGMKYNDFLLKISGHLEDILYSFVGNLSLIRTS